jgi:sulfite exporter TauE/SafE
MVIVGAAAIAKARGIGNLQSRTHGMKHIAATALAVLLISAGTAYAQPSACKSEARQRHLTGTAFKTFVARCKKALAAYDSASKSRPRMSPADEERLDRAMRRNILQSIEDELRTKRIGK